MTDDDLVASWLAGFGPNTAAAYRRDLAQFRSWVGDTPLADVDRARAQAYVNHLKEAGLSDPTVRRKRSAASSLYIYAQTEGVTVTNPFARVRVPRGGTVEKLGLSLDQVERLLAAARTEGPTAAALVALMVTTGCRISGAVGAQVTDLHTDGDHKVLRIRLKGGSDKRVPLAPAVHEAILEAIAGRTDGPIFTLAGGKPLTRTTAGRWITRLGRLAGVGHVTPHVLRHTTAGLLAGDGVDPIKIKELLGHRSIQTTMGYVHLVAGLDDNPAYHLADKLLADNNP
jgi:site-specific recombinase XerD